MGKREAQSRQCSKIWNALIFIDSGDGELKENNQKRMEKVGSSNGGGTALHKRNKEALQLPGN